MERCINQSVHWYRPMVSGSHGVSQPIANARIISASNGMDVPDLAYYGVKKTLSRLPFASTVPVRHRCLGKKLSDNGSAKTGTGEARCAASDIGSTSDSQQIAESENSSDNSSSSQCAPMNCYTEGGLELVKTFEDAEKEVLKVALRKDPASEKQSRDELKGPTWIESGPSLIKSETENVHEFNRSSCNFGPNKGTERQITNVEASSSAIDGGIVGGSVESDLLEERTFATGPSSTRHEEEQSKSIWQQMKDIILFAGPALGIWLSAPIMSLIDTCVVGQTSSLELAALGPGTILCDQLSYVFTFLSIATSNLIATSLAKKDKAGAERHLSRLLFVSMACGLGMLLFIEFYGTSLLRAFVGAKNVGLIPAARTYVEIRGYAWPAVLVGMVAQSASLGMKDSWGPLKVLAISTFISFLGDIVLCTYLGFGIAGAAWSTMASQVIAALLMLKSLHQKGYNPLAIAIPSVEELVQMIRLSGPVFLTMMSKMAFYAVITYLATSLGAIPLAAHQVMIGVYSMCTVSGEPLAQTAQSFMPSMIYGVNCNIRKARKLLHSLLLIGTIFGLSLGCIAITMPWFFPQVFTSDIAVIRQMRGVTIPFFWSLVITPPTLSLEGTLLASRDLMFFSFSMVSCFCGGCILLVLLDKSGFGLVGSWWTLVAFQWARFALAFIRLASPKSVLKGNMFSAGDSGLHLKTI